MRSQISIKLFSSNQDYSAAFSSRGFAYARLSQASSSLADSEQAIRLDPENSQAYLVRGLVRSRIGELDGALADANQGLKLNPQASLWIRIAQHS